MTGRCLERSCPLRFRDGVARYCRMHADSAPPRPAPVLPELTPAPAPRVDLEQRIAEALR